MSKMTNLYVLQDKNNKKYLSSWLNDVELVDDINEANVYHKFNNPHRPNSIIKGYYRKVFVVLISVKVENE